MARKKRKLLDALNPKKNLRTRQEEINDIASYAHTLSKEDKEWLAAFVEEEINAKFDHTGPKLNDTTDQKVRSRLYDRNNARNRCIYTREVAQGAMNYLEDMDLDKNRNAEKEDDYD